MSDSQHPRLDPSSVTEPRAGRNRFDRMEWAGAFGDLGTFIPFVVAYVTVLKMDPVGVLFAFGSAMVICGLYYKTPFPVQPMKAIGAIAATQAAQTAVITPSTVYCASLATGVLWLVLGLTGATGRIVKLVPRAVIVGIVLGLGLSFMLEGIKMMQTGWPIAAIALLGTLLLLTNRVLPAMFLVLVFGAACGAIQHPALLSALGSSHLELHFPHLQLASLDRYDLFVGTFLLALPQLPLTLGNAIIAVTEENNRLFPGHPVKENGVAVSTGIMNVGSALCGGVPMCHGAGGMAGHVAFGARTGGAPILLGSILLVLALCFGGSITTILEFFPKEVLGVILFLTGAQLALGSCDFGKNKAERFTTLATAAFSMWNVGLAFVVGLTLGHIAKRGWLRL
jgi:MFS superfamily sulfate permease-like transporter